MTDIKQNTFEPITLIERPAKLAVLISGGGRTLENLARCINEGTLEAVIAVVIASRSDIGGMARCERLGIEVQVIDYRLYDNIESYSKAHFELIRSAGVHLVCLAGFLRFLQVPSDYAGRIINIHPALLPEFGGRGMYGRRVHRAVLEAGRTESGCTVHYVDNEYDHGEVIAQQRVLVLDGDSPEQLAARVFEQECVIYPQAIRLLQGVSP